MSNKKFKILTIGNPMIKLIYNTTNNKPAIFHANSSEQAISILKMKEDALYYDFLLKKAQS